MTRIPHTHTNIHIYKGRGLCSNNYAAVSAANAQKATASLQPLNCNSISSMEYFHFINHTGGQRICCTPCAVLSHRADAAAATVERGTRGMGLMGEPEHYACDLSPPRRRRRRRRQGSCHAPQSRAWRVHGYDGHGTATTCVDVVFRRVYTLENSTHSPA